MPGVKNLKIQVQAGTVDTLFASWEFKEDQISSSIPQAANGSSAGSGSIKVGDLVSIKSGAKYYNGVTIPSWVLSDQWYVVQVSGNRAVLGKNKSGSSNIQSAIDVKYLIGGSGTSSSGSGGGSSSSGSSSTTETQYEKTLDYYDVVWKYNTGQGDVWFLGSETTTKLKNQTYNPPSNAKRIKCWVRPVAKKYTVNDKEVAYWTGVGSTVIYNMSENPPSNINTPTVTINGFELTSTVDGVTDGKADFIQFQVYDGDTLYRTAEVRVEACRAIFTCAIKDGGKYRVRARAVNRQDKGYIITRTYGEWTSFSGENVSGPTTVTNVKVVATTTKSVRVTWTPVDTATSYKIEYTKDASYFDTSSEVQSVTVTKAEANISGLDSSEWFFRVQAINPGGESAWSNVVSTIIGTKPEPPTTWSLTTTAIIGEEIVLYWVHNCEDGSTMTEATIEIDINGTIESHIIAPSQNDTVQQEAIQSYKFTPSGYDEGAIIKWRVKTKGLVPDYGDWSVQRTINLYAPPSLSLVISVDDAGMLTALPLHVSLSSGPSTQTPISYHVSIIANTSYETSDDVGNGMYVSSGSEVYSKALDISDPNYEFDISAGDVRLEDGQIYTIAATVSMNSGLTAETTIQFMVIWSDYEFMPDASIGIDERVLSAYINPFAWDSNYSLAENVTLAVYRREYNGGFTKIADNIPNDRITTVVDPHPSLDYARYRIVAKSEVTGSVSYEDLPGYPIGDSSIVIQWDEKWSNFDYSYEDEMEEPIWAGSMLKLPYNVDVSESNDPDTSLIEYIGRKHPVSYYGTHRREKATWSTDIDKKDKKTIYALRRLSAWAGDVYVREPSGLGYWAQIKVTMPIKHLDLVIPVTFEITRVEGGI